MIAQFSAGVSIPCFLYLFVPVTNASVGVYGLVVLLTGSLITWCQELIM